MGICGSTTNKEANDPSKNKDSKKDKDSKKLQIKAENPNKFFLISGPSGVGKGTLLKELFANYPNQTKFSVSYTTRGPRPGEENGKDYNFITEEEFVAEIEKGNFLEHVHFSGMRYGTSKHAIEGALTEGKICVLDVEINGARMIKDSGFPGVLVFVKPPKFEDLEKRLRARGTETEEKINKRVAQAKEDLEKLEADNFFTHTIVNDDLKVAVND